MMAISQPFLAIFNQSFQGKSKINFKNTKIIWPRSYPTLQFQSRFYVQTFWKLLNHFCSASFPLFANQAKFCLQATEQLPWSIFSPEEHHYTSLKTKRNYRGRRAPSHHQATYIEGCHFTAKLLKRVVSVFFVQQICRKEAKKYSKIFPRLQRFSFPTPQHSRLCASFTSSTSSYTHFQPHC